MKRIKRTDGTLDFVPDPQVYVAGSYPVPPVWVSADSPILKTWACGHRRRADSERSPRELCQACWTQARKHRQHWSALALAIVLALLVLAAVAGDR